MLKKLPAHHEQEVELKSGIKSCRANLPCLIQIVQPGVNKNGRDLFTA